MTHRCSGASTRASATSSSTSRVEVDRAPLEGTAGVEARQQQQVLDQRRHPLGLDLDLAHGLPQGGGLVLGTGAPGQLGVPLDGRQRRPQLVRGVGDELPHLLLARVPRAQRVLHVVEQGVERRADLPDLGAVVGQLGRHAGGVADLALRQRYGGHVVRGGGDLAQRAHLTADQDDGETAGQPDADEDQHELARRPRGPRSGRRWRSAAR